MCFYLTEMQSIDLSIHRYYIYVCVCTHIGTSVIIHLVVYIVKTNYVVNFFTDWLRVIENISPDSHSKYLVQFIKGKCCRNRASPPELLNRVFAGAQGRTAEEI